MPFLNLLLILLNSFQFRLVVAEIIFCVCFPVRRGRHLILILGVATIISVPIAMGLLDGTAFYSLPMLELGGVNVSFLLVFAVSCVLLAVCFEIGLWELVFVGTGSFITQNIVYDVAMIVGLVVFPNSESYLTYDSLDYFSTNVGHLYYNCVSVLILIAAYTAVYLIFIRRWKRDHQLHIGGVKLIAFLAVMIIFLNVISSAATDNGEANLYVFTLLAGCSVMLLLIQFNFFDLSRVEYEKEMEGYMARVAMRQQKMSQETVDIINIKAHDLKRSIAALKLQLNGEAARKELANTERIVEKYNSIIQTGNEALDTILTEKNLTCGQSHIEFTFLVDGKALAFMEPLDVFLLFGNAIDNAIERVRLEAEENRVIFLKVFFKGQSTMVVMENYCSDRLVFKDGLPQTIKEDKNYHGFGMKSIRSIVEKYRGNMVVSQEGNMFVLNILFPQAFAYH